jgi:hypothetical protein
MDEQICGKEGHTSEPAGTDSLLSAVRWKDDMSEMRMPLDDQQVSRHAMGQMADQTKILYDELSRVGFSGALCDKLIEIWWRALMAQMLSPNFSEMLAGLSGMFESDDEEE